MKRFLSLIFLALVSCTKPKSDIIVDLSNQEGHGPFRLGQVLVFPSEDSLHFQGVPKEIKEFVVRSVVLQRFPAATENNRNLSPASKEKPQSPQTNGQEVSPPIDSEVLFLIGTKSNKRVIVVDSDNDEDFSNEEILEYEYPLPLEKQKEIRDNLPTVIIQYECLENNQKVTKKAKMRPTPYAGSLILTYNRPIKKIEKEYFLAVSFLEYKEGKIVLNDTDCSIYVSNGFTKITYPKDRVSVFVTPSGDKMPAELENDDIPYEIGDVFNVKGRDFQIDSITNFGDKLFIKDIGENTKPVGVTEGFYVPKFFAKRLDNSVFELNQFPNKFVLLDFWGTWCGPCRALIPELKKLNDEFSNKNFVMVSVAYDKDPQKVSDVVSREQMNWEHVFVSQNDQDKNSLVDKLKISSFPTTILIGPDGKILARTEDLDKIREIVNRGLTKN